MNRTHLSIVVSVVLALMGLGFGASAATPSGSATHEMIGSPPGGFVIPAHATASFTNAEFGACNNLSWGYQLDAGPNMVQATFPGGCFSQTAPDVTIGPFAAPTLVRVFLQDNTCGQIYYSDGLPVDHVIVSGSNPYQLRFADAGGFCERLGPATNFTGFNFRVTLTISRSAADLLAELLLNVQGLPPGNSLAAKVEAAQKSLANGNTSALCGQLDALINELTAQSGKHLTEAQASALITAVQQIKALIPCP